MEADPSPREIESEAPPPEPPPRVFHAEIVDDNPFVPPAPPPVYVAPPPPPPLPPPGAVPSLLAGLESGILGAVLMIAWFALDSIWERQYWWAMLNLWGAGVYHNRVFSMGFGVATLAGASMHFFLHGIAGALWALLGSRISNYWLHLVCSFGAAAALHLFLLYAFWPTVAPVVSRLTPLPATALAYFLFGAAMSRTAHRAREIGLIWET